MTLAHRAETLEVDGTRYTYPAAITLDNGANGISMSIRSFDPKETAIIVGMNAEQALALAAQLTARAADITSGA